MDHPRFAYLAATAALTLSAGQVIVLVRVLTGHAASTGHQLWASLTPTIVFSGRYAFCGFLAHEGVAI